MRKSITSMVFWMALLSVGLMVPEHAGAIGPIISSGPGLDPPLRVASVSGVVPLNGPGSGGSMLQFKAGGHVLGFQPNKVFLAGLDHALSIEFLGTQGVMPISAATAPATDSTTGAPLLATVVYRNLWEGVSLSYEATEEGIAESIYHVAPGGDVSSIRLRCNVPVEPQGDGSLRYRFARGYVTESPPVAWQEVEGNRVPVTAEFRVSGDEVGFVLGPYDRTQSLIIDPTYAWHTFYGSGNYDVGNDIAVDSNGNVYVTGISSETWGSPLRPHSGGDDDIFVLKLDRNGAYKWHTFYGSSSDDEGTDIAVDGSGNVYVTGNSWTGWGSPLHAHSGFKDIFVLKLDSGGAYQWHTFYGTGASDSSTGFDLASGIALDGSGNVYVTGTSEAGWGTPLSPHSGDLDVFVLKLAANGASQWHTYFGTTTYDCGLGIAVDGSGNVYVTGYTGSSGNDDLFVLKLAGNGVRLWNKLYGSTSFDYGRSIAVDGGGNVVVTGYSNATWGSPLHAHDTGYDLFVLKLESGGAYQWHTFYGATGTDHGYDIAVDGSDNVYVTGLSNATWGSPLHAFSGGSDLFLLKLNSSGAYQWHTFYGATVNSPAFGDVGYGIAVGGSGSVHVAGMSNATWGSPLNAYTGASDVCALKVAQPAVGSVDFNGDVRNDILWRHTGGASYLWQMDGLTAKTVGYIPPIDPSWQVTALADFNGDGTTDILWRHTGGMLYTWMMNGATAVGLGSPGTVDPSWSVLGVADFGGDGKADILWRHTGGAFYLWEMNGISALKVGTIPSIDVSWQVNALADFNGDGKADILWRHTSGMLYLWLMDGATAIGVGSPGTVDPSWTITGAANFTDDMKADILWRDKSGAMAMWQMDGATLLNVGMLGAVDLSWSIADAHDFNADGKADILWRHSSGATSLWLMNGFTRIGEGSLGVIDPSWKIENH